MVTSNQIQLLVQDSGGEVISRSMQLAARRTAQQYNRRKTRQGAFWENRYHATAIETDAHVHRCVVYMDLNMVRAGVVNQPNAWKHSGYKQIQNPSTRYRLIDPDTLRTLCGFSSTEAFQRAHCERAETSLTESVITRQSVLVRVKRRGK